MITDAFWSQAPGYLGKDAIKHKHSSRTSDIVSPSTQTKTPNQFFLSVLKACGFFGAVAEMFLFF